MTHDCDCPFCDYEDDEPWIPPRLTVRQRIRRAGREILYRLHLRKRPPFEQIMATAMDAYRDSMVDMLHSEPVMMKWLREKNERER